LVFPLARTQVGILKTAAAEYSQTELVRRRVLPAANRVAEAETEFGQLDTRAAAGDSARTAAVQLNAGALEFRAKIGSISRQSTIYVAGTLLTTAAAYFFKIYLARKLGAEALGLYALGMTIAGFLGVFNSLGLPSAAARFVSEYSATRRYDLLGSFLRHGLGLLSACNVLLGLAMLLVGPWIVTRFYHAASLTPTLWAFALIMLVGVLTTFLGQVMAGYQDVARRTLITHFIGSPATIVFSIILLSFGFGLQGYMAAQVLSALVVLALLGISVWRMTPVVARFGGRTTRIEREVVAFSAVSFGIAALQFVLAQADKIVLGYYLSARMVGVYSVAMALVALVPIALQSVNQIFSPVIAELHATGNKALLQQLYSTLTKWIFIVTFPLALTIIAFAGTLMGVFGPEFQAGSTALAIGTTGQLFNCAVGSVGFLLLMSGHQTQLMKIQGVSAAAMIALSLVLVPRLGLIGTAVAAAASVVLTNLWSLISVRRRLGLFPYNSGYLKLVIPAILSGAFITVMARWSLTMPSRWHFVFPALFGAYVCFIGTVPLWGLDSLDRLFARMVWEKASGILQYMEIKPRE
jgi:O-antigen/teichoic acid export membrane protein